MADQSHATMRVMRYGHVAGIDRPVARIVLGSTSFAQGRADLAKDLIETYLAAGGNIVDTAQSTVADGLTGTSANGFALVDGVKTS